MVDDCNINNLAKNQVSAVFNSRAIRRTFALQSGHEVDTTVFLRKEKETGTSRWVLNSFVLSLIVIATTVLC